MCFFIGKVISHLMDTSLRGTPLYPELGPAVLQSFPNLVPVPARESFLFTLYG